MKIGKCTKAREAREAMYENRKSHRRNNNDKISSTVPCIADNILIKQKNLSIQWIPHHSWFYHYSSKNETLLFFSPSFFDKIENSSLRILTENIAKWNVIYLRSFLGTITKEDIHGR